MSEEIKKEPQEAEEKLTILELAEYYANRYNLYVESPREDYVPLQNGLSKYCAQIKRIMQGISVNGKSLWIDTKPTDKKLVHQISISRFEDLCFDKWATYIRTKCPECDKKCLEEDIEKHRRKNDKQYRLQKIAEKKAIRDKAIENGGNLPDEFPDPEVSEEELKAKGHAMMLEALYSIFYESFDWERLHKDLLDSKYDLDAGYNEDTPEEIDQAREDIKNFRNYIGKRKTTVSAELFRKTTPKKLP